MADYYSFTVFLYIETYVVGGRVTLYVHTSALSGSYQPMAGIMVLAFSSVPSILALENSMCHKPSAGPYNQAAEQTPLEGPRGKTFCPRDPSVEKSQDFWHSKIPCVTNPVLALTTRQPSRHHRRRREQNCGIPWNSLNFCEFAGCLLIPHT